MFRISISSFLLLPNSGFCFAANRSLLNLLFQTIAEVLNGWCKENGLTPGFCLILHTFGGKLDFHPHIHVLFAAGGIDTNGKWKNLDVVPWYSWKSRFRAILVRKLRAWAKEKTLAIPKGIVSFWKKKNGVSDLFSVLRILFSVTWYVHVGEKLGNADYTVRYIGRYAKRPCLSEAKIVSYDGEFVTFEYKDKLLGEYARLRLTADEFIGRLIRHIPENGFRMIRYCGFYSNRTPEKKEKLRSSLPRSYRGAFRFEKNTAQTWRERIAEKFGADPLACPKCGEVMKLCEIAYRARDGTLRVVAIGRTSRFGDFVMQMR